MLRRNRALAFEKLRGPARKHIPKETSGSEQPLQISQKSVPECVDYIEVLLRVSVLKATMLNSTSVWCVLTKSSVSTM